MSRPRSVEQLNAGLVSDEYFARRLTLVSAPAFFGKTTLVSEWVNDLGCPFCWLSLDRGDNDPARFLAYLFAALQSIDSNIGQAALGILQSPQPLLSQAFLTSLINDIAATPISPRS